jgi:hypothetical protein
MQPLSYRAVTFDTEPEYRIRAGGSRMVQFIRTQLQQENMQRLNGARPRTAILIPRKIAKTPPNLLLFQGVIAT